MIKHDDRMLVPVTFNDAFEVIGAAVQGLAAVPEEQKPPLRLALKRFTAEVVAARKARLMVLRSKDEGC